MLNSGGKMVIELYRFIELHHNINMQTARNRKHGQCSLFKEQKTTVMFLTGCLYDNA